MIKYIKSLSILLLLFSFLCTVSLVADENGNETEDYKKIRENTIKYGIGSQVIDLVSQLKEEENDRYNDLLVELFETTGNNSLRIGIVGLFSTLEDDSLVNKVYTILEEYEDLSSELVLSSISYIAQFQNTAITDRLFELAEALQSEVATAAIRAIGESGEKENGRRLLQFSENDDFRDELEPSLIYALGELQYREAVDYLIEIALDEDQSNSHRWRACEALGKIGGEESFQTIKSLLNDDDSYLRSYAVNALSGFKEERTLDILIDALRDDFWRVRVGALGALEKIGSPAALDVLEYKVYNDPDVRNVRYAALKALGSIESQKAYSILRELYGKKTEHLLLRKEALRILVEKDLNSSLKIINSVIDDEWSEENSEILDYTCRQLSLTRSSSLKEVFKRMLIHPRSINIMLYGLRGIRLNEFTSLKPDVEVLTGSGYARSVRQLARSVLEDL